MGSLSIWHWLILILVVMVLFGRGKISDMMGDVAKGIKSFKKGMAEDDDDKPHTIDHEPGQSMASDPVEKKTKVG
jgi:sec-independent protein translocase protein TatA